MRKNKILTAIALSISLTAFTGISNAASHMEGYDSSIEYSQYRNSKSTYLLRASDIIGADLENAKGEGVGEVDDLIVTRKDNKLMAIVSVGGFLGMGDRLVMVPYEGLRMGKEAGNVFLDVNKASLEKMPEFKYEDGEPSGYDRMTSRRQTRDGSVEANERVGYDKSVMYSKYRNKDSNYKLRVSEIIGEEIENAKGDNIGEVDDLIVPRNGKDLLAVVSVGGFLGMGDKLVLVPYSELRVAGDGDELYMTATEKTLKARPAFKYNEGESTGTELLNVRSRYVNDDVKADLNETKTEAKAEMKDAKEKAKETVSAVAGAGAAAVSSFKESVGYTDTREAKSPYHLRMSEALGKDVKNAKDEEIGEVDDLVMSRDGDFLMAIISVGGFLGMGDKLVSVPYNELRVGKDGEDFYLNSTKEMLKSRAEFKYNEGEISGRDTLDRRMKAE